MLDNVAHAALRTNSLALLAGLVQDNVYAVDVIKNVFPKFLLDKVKPSRSSREIADTWTSSDWLSFF
jgi:hypothetical protein